MPVTVPVDCAPRRRGRHRRRHAVDADWVPYAPFVKGVPLWDLYPMLQAPARSGPGILANVRVTPGAVEGLPATAGPDPTATDPRYVRAWNISPVTSLADGAGPDFASRPTGARGWTPCAAIGWNDEVWVFVNGSPGGA